MLCESVNCGERIKGRLEVSGIRTRFESPIGDRPVTNAAGPFLRPIRQAGEKYLNTRNGVATNSTRERISARAASHPPTREAVGRVGERVCASRGGGLNRASPAGGNSPRPLHGRKTESAQAERCVGAGGHQPRRGWPGPLKPLGGWHRGGAWSVRPSAL